MTFDDYYNLLQAKPRGRQYKLIYPPVYQSYGVTAAHVRQLKNNYEQLLAEKLSHIEGIVDQKIILINTNGLQDIQTIRDFYHYFYYYLFYKSRSLLIRRDCLDCSRHIEINDRLVGIVDVRITDLSLNWLTNNFDQYKNLRTIADYYFDDARRIMLTTRQTLTDAQRDWLILKGLTL